LTVDGGKVTVGGEQLTDDGRAVMVDGDGR